MPDAYLGTYLCNALPQLVLTVCTSCRCLELTLEIAYKREQTLQQTLEAGMMPVIIHALGNYMHMLHQNAAVQTDAEGSPSDSPQSSAGAPVPGPVPTHSAVLAALSICEVISLCIILALLPEVASSASVMV